MGNNLDFMAWATIKRNQYEYKRRQYRERLERQGFYTDANRMREQADLRRKRFEQDLFYFEWDE